jgi:hypothetical protein
MPETISIDEFKGNDFELGYFTVHHRKNGRDKEAYFA